MRDLGSGKIYGSEKQWWEESQTHCQWLRLSRPSYWAHVEATAWKVPRLPSLLLITLKTAASRSLPPTLPSLLSSQSICLCFGAAFMFRCPSQAGVLSLLPPLSPPHGTLHRSSPTGSVPHLAPPKGTQTT